MVHRSNRCPFGYSIVHGIPIFINTWNTVQCSWTVQSRVVFDRSLGVSRVIHWVVHSAGRRHLSAATFPSCDHCDHESTDPECNYHSCDGYDRPSRNTSG